MNPPQLRRAALAAEIHSFKHTDGDIYIPVSVYIFILGLLPEIDAIKSMKKPKQFTFKAYLIKITKKRYDIYIPAISPYSGVTPNTISKKYAYIKAIASRVQFAHPLTSKQLFFITLRGLILNLF